MELADALVITKADGDNRLRAKTAQGEYERAMHYLQPATEGWTSHAFTCSALTGEGIPEIWGVIKKFRQITQASGVFEQHRRDQNVKWVHEMINDQLHERFISLSSRAPALMVIIRITYATTWTPVPSSIRPSNPSG